MGNENFLLQILFIIFSGAAILATFVLFTRQSLLVAYMLLGVVFGPYSLKIVPNAHIIKETGDVGILFLLFLLGLHLDPHDLFNRLKKVSWVGLSSSTIFFIIGYLIGYLFKFNNTESLIIGASMMFSSTMIGLKLLPVHFLHKQVGHVMVGILLLQDLLAIAVMLFLHAASQSTISWRDIAFVFISLPTLLLISFVVEYFILRYLFRRFEKIQEYIFLIAIAWCLCMAEFARYFGLPAEMGAFIAGVAIAEGPAAYYIAESLKSLRDFFLVLFFFTIGASFNWHELPEVIIPATILAASSLLLKPMVFNLLLKGTGEVNHVAKEVAIRLGQASEFSIIIVAIATTSLANLVNDYAVNLITAMTMMTFIVSCYWVVLAYPTPMTLDKKLQEE